MEETAQHNFDISLATECAVAFAVSTGLPTSIEDITGNPIYSYGGGCANCAIRSLVEKNTNVPPQCQDIHLYGLLQAQRFGGKYIYFCPCGFNFTISPIISEKDEVEAYIKAGPFLMVDKDDYIKYDLSDLLQIPAAELTDIDSKLEGIEFIPPEKVTKLSDLLYMSIGFVNNVTVSEKQRQQQNSEEIQGHISDILSQLKAQDKSSDISYPFNKEAELITAVTDGDKATSNRLLNELLGYIFFCSGGKFEIIRARVFELLVLFSRAAVEGGADAEQIFLMNQSNFYEINRINNLDALCVWLSGIMNNLADCVFRFDNVKHIDIIRKAVDYVRRNYAKKITLEDVAASIYLSPSYFSKVFKEEMGINFNLYLNKVRIDKAKKLLLNEQAGLVEISGLVGFEDQSYFSKVFKKVTNQTPGKFRNSGGKK